MTPSLRLPNFSGCDGLYIGWSTSLDLIGKLGSIVSRAQLVRRSREASDISERSRGPSESTNQKGAIQKWSRSSNLTEPPCYDVAVQRQQQSVPRH